MQIVKVVNGGKETYIFDVDKFCPELVAHPDFIQFFEQFRQKGVEITEKNAEIVQILIELNSIVATKDAINDLSLKFDNYKKIITDTLQLAITQPKDYETDITQLKTAIRTISLMLILFVGCALLFAIFVTSHLKY